VFIRERLDAVISPQMRTALAPLHGGDIIHETAVCEINIAGCPGVTVPAGITHPARRSG
jgi:aspartyl-tRNA(Asn)/glutamyl-tRNA(Gln) amidotransferase subunit A